jgi:hypothetical protein
MGLLMAFEAERVETELRRSLTREGASRFAPLQLSPFSFHYFITHFHFHISSFITTCPRSHRPPLQIALSSGPDNLQIPEPVSQFRTRAVFVPVEKASWPSLEEPSSIDSLLVGTEAWTGKSQQSLLLRLCKSHQYCASTINIMGSNTLLCFHHQHGTYFQQRLAHRLD